MNQVKFYQKLPEMVCLQGDTLQIFDIPVIGLDSLSGCSMLCIIEDSSVDGAVVLSKSCTKEDNSFRIQLTSEETAALSGTYKIHFRMTDADGLQYRKLAGMLTVRPVAQGG